MNIHIHIPNAIENRVIDGIATATAWTAASGLTKEDWAKAQILKALRNFVYNGEVRAQAAILRPQADALAITVT